MEIDMTKNERPWGLLSGAEREAICEHCDAGGAVEVYGGGGEWSRCAGVAEGNLAAVLRTVPLPCEAWVIICGSALSPAACCASEELARAGLRDFFSHIEGARVVHMREVVE